MRMIMTTLFGLGASALLAASPAATPVIQAQPSYVFTNVLPTNGYISYVASEHDTLATVAKVYYGDEAYWTTLWNDNPTINDPDALPDGLFMNVRSEKPSEPEKLHTELDNRNDALTEQKNATYLTTIGYDAPVIEATQAPTPVVIEPVVTQAPVAVQAPSTISDEAVTYLGNCEAGNDPAKNTGNGYYGAFQFSYGTWKSLNTGYERADLAPYEVQKAAVQQLLQRSSIFHQFPACANKMRNEGII